MYKNFSLDDPATLVEAAKELTNSPVPVNDAVVESFLSRFPLPLIFLALENKGHMEGLEDALVSCLRSVFGTKYGLSLLPLYMEFMLVGLKRGSPQIRCLACEAVGHLLESDDETVSSVELIANYDIYPILLDCVINSTEQVANAAMDVIKTLACTPDGLEIIFPAKTEETHLQNVVSRCSSSGRLRVLTLMVKLYATSPALATSINKLNIFSFLEDEMHHSDDILAKLIILELFYELAEVPHCTNLLPRVSLIQFLSAIISDLSVNTLLRSRAMVTIGRLLGNEKILSSLDDQSIVAAISTINKVHDQDSQDLNEWESAVGVLGMIGSTIRGGNLLLASSSSSTMQVIDAAFGAQGRSIQLAGLHALGNLSGETRGESCVMLSDEAEETLKRLIYDASAKTSKLTPSGLFLSILQQDSEVRLAAYRMLSNLVFRPWCLMEICSKRDIIDFLTDPMTETTKIGMDAKYSCCKAIHKALSSSTLTGNPSYSKISAKLEEALRRGPYAGASLREAQPVVQTADRF